MKFIQPTIISVMVVSLLITTACNNETKNAENTDNNKSGPAAPAQQLVFDKLVGTWQSEDGKSFERWAKNEDNTYRSVAFSVKGKDTSWNEQARIYPENDTWVFENNEKGQNDGKAVKFISSSITGNSIQFSNPASCKKPFVVLVWLAQSRRCTCLHIYDRQDGYHRPRYQCLDQTDEILFFHLDLLLDNGLVSSSSP